MSATQSNPGAPIKPLDLELVAQRILKLAEISTLEHLESLALSQAHRLVELRKRLEISCRN